VLENIETLLESSMKLNWRSFWFLYTPPPPKFLETSTNFRFRHKCRHTLDAYLCKHFDVNCTEHQMHSNMFHNFTLFLPMNELSWQDTLRSSLTVA
jgi:hypothetical protein